MNEVQTVLSQPTQLNSICTSEEAKDLSEACPKDCLTHDFPEVMPRVLGQGFSACNV